MTSVFSVLAIAVLVSIDQGIKWLAVERLMPVERIPAVPGIFEWNYTENTGAAFGALSEHTAILTIVTLIIICVGLAVLLSGKIKNKLIYTSAVLILSGGIGNVIDRMFRGGELFNGYVVDYIKVLFMNFAVFNFADCLITVGAFMIILYLIIDLVKDAKGKKSLKE